VECRDDDRGADDDENDERADPEYAAPDALCDLAHRDHADVAERVTDGPPAQGVASGVAGELVALAGRLPGHAATLQVMSRTALPPDPE
jgi:hypothetical protein